MKKYILALDEGTTSARAILFDENADVIACAQNEFPQYYPQAGWVEQDPMEIYASQYAALTECIAKSGVSPTEIAALGITNQRETTVVWNKETGEPIYSAIVWQCRRTAPLCEELIRSGKAEMIKKITGLRIDPYFSATKIKWILDNVKDARDLAAEGKLAFGTVDTWLVFKLTEGKVFVTDYTNASRTMLCNIHTGEWDDTLLSLFDIPRSMLPEIKSSSEIYGTFSCMGASIAIAGIAGDQQAALFGQGCLSAGEAKNTYGTGCFLLTHTGQNAIESEEGLLTTIAATEKGCPLSYALEGSVFVGGAVIRWLRDEMHLIYDAKDSEYYASQVANSGGVFFVPAFAGLGTPYWDMHARGTLVGLSRGTGRNHIIRAALEAIALQTEDVLSAMKKDMRHFLGEDADISVLRVDGGASRNNLLLQMQSDFSGIPVLRSANAEATALGAAFLAGLAVGFFRDHAEIRKKVMSAERFAPMMSSNAREAHLKNWKKAVAACRAFSYEEP